VQLALASLALWVSGSESGRHASLSSFLFLFLFRKLCPRDQRMHVLTNGCWRALILANLPQPDWRPSFPSFRHERRPRPAVAKYCQDPPQKSTSRRFGPVGFRAGWDKTSHAPHCPGPGSRRVVFGTGQHSTGCKFWSGVCEGIRDKSGRRVQQLSGSTAPLLVGAAYLHMRPSAALQR
jgi:hypothetical protein